MTENEPTDLQEKEIQEKETLDKVMGLGRKLHDDIEELNKDKKRLQSKNLVFRDRADLCSEICSKMLKLETCSEMKKLIEDLSSYIREMRV